MKLSEKQSKFTVAMAQLILHADSLGYGLTGGDLYRDPRCEYGHPKSTHRSRLAVDFNLFQDGEYLQGSDAEYAHNILHNFWDIKGGARRLDGDLNHYSFTHLGVI